MYNSYEQAGAGEQVFSKMNTCLFKFEQIRDTKTLGRRRQTYKTREKTPKNHFSDGPIRFGMVLGHARYFPVNMHG